MRRSNVLSLPFSKGSLRLGLQFQNMSKLQLTGRNLGRVFNYKSPMYPVRLRCYEAKLPSLLLKTRNK